MESDYMNDLRRKVTSTPEVTRLIKEAESAKELAQVNEAFLKNITRVLPQYVFLKDTSSMYIWCNQNYATLVGLDSPDDIVGKTDQDLNWQSVGHTAETFQKGDKDTIEGHPITNQEEVLALPSGKTIVTLVSKLPIIDNGKVLGIVGYFTDITELKNKEKEIIKAKKQAEIANEAKSTFISNISHDVRTPLAGIIGMARILSKEVQTEEGQVAAYNLVRSADVLLDLMNEVIEVTKLASDELPVYDVKFNIRNLIEQISVLEKPSAQEKHLALNVNIDKRIPRYLIGDKTRIHRILLNLVSNAIKFTQHGSVDIVLRLSKQEGKDIVIKLLVKDTGIGMHPEHQNIIFSRFGRLEAAYKGNYKGSGLGLSIVKQFITEIDGEIYVESKPGEGSTFTCVIPLKKALLDEPDNEAIESIQPEMSNKESETKLNDNPEITTEKQGSTSSTDEQVKVLLVEDTPIARMAARNILNEQYCEVIEAETGEKAIELFQQDNYDLVLMDIGLPKKDGIEATEEIRTWERSTKKNTTTPVIALTAHVDESNQAQCLKAGMDAVYTKPLDEMTLEKILNNHVHQASSQEEQSNGERTPTIDLNLGAQILHGTKAEALDMLTMLVDTLPDTEQDIHKAFERQDYDKLQFIVHKLNGSASYCGVPKLKEAAKSLEYELQKENLNSIEQQYAELREEINKVLEEYKQIK